MYGPGHPPQPTPMPPRRLPSRAWMVSMRVLFVVLSVGSIGLLLWAPLLRLAIVRRRTSDWWLTGAGLRVHLCPLADHRQGRQQRRRQRHRLRPHTDAVPGDAGRPRVLPGRGHPPLRAARKTAFRRMGTCRRGTGTRPCRYSSRGPLSRSSTSSSHSSTSNISRLGTSPTPRVRTLGARNPSPRNPSPRNPGLRSARPRPPRPTASTRSAPSSTS